MDEDWNLFEDHFVWNNTTSGVYTVKSAYYTARGFLGRSEQVDQRMEVWKLICSVKN